MDDLRAAFGDRLRALRRERQLSQEALAEEADLHWTYISDLGRGEQTPTLDVVNRLARAFQISLAEFFAPFDGGFRARRRRARHDRRQAVRKKAST